MFMHVCIMIYSCCCCWNYNLWSYWIEACSSNYIIFVCDGTSLWISKELTELTAIIIIHNQLHQSNFFIIHWLAVIVGPDYASIFYDFDIISY